MQGENERLRAHIQQHIAQLAHTEAQLADTAAFLDRKAREFSTMGFDHDAADCRREARKLRGET